MEPAAHPAVDSHVAALVRAHCARAQRELADLDNAIAQGGAGLRAKLLERGALAPLAAGGEALAALTVRMDEARSLLAEEGLDEDLAQAAREELAQAQQQQAILLETLACRLAAGADATVGSLWLEYRAASGGAEAALFAGELLEMHMAFAKRHGWRCEVVDWSPGEAGGLRHGILVVEGEGAWQALGYEGGVHCVKRVPATETQGRIHTSTVAVAVLPEPAEVDVSLDPADVTEELYCASSGPGGQNVNKVATAVRLLHRPSGMEVRISESRSQSSNRDRAWALLRARVAQERREREAGARREARATMMGGGQRSERARTYRFKEGVVVDDRLAGAPVALAQVMAGGLDELVARLRAVDMARRIEALGASAAGS